MVSRSSFSTARKQIISFMRKSSASPRKWERSTGSNRREEMATVKSKIFIVVGAFVLLWFARFVWDYFDPTSVANQAMQIQLRLFGSAMYEYHTATKRWPTKLDDLAQTSLPKRSYIWQQTATTMVFLWPQDLNPDPKYNADVLLAYDRGGLYNKLGRVWVCWGDLRTERLREHDLRARLPK